MKSLLNLEESQLALEDASLKEVTCSECHKPITTIPAWLAGADVKFQCEECRQKHPRVPGMAEAEPRRGIASDVDELGDLSVVEEIVEEDVEEEVVDEHDDYAE
jgi:hypothetical protein